MKTSQNSTNNKRLDMKIFSIFNNKGGVGKTTYLYHITHYLAEKGYKTLVLDLDSQANFTSYALSDQQIESQWENGNSIWRVVEPLTRGTGDFAKVIPYEVRDHLFLTLGDLSLGFFEDFLGDTWTSAKGGQELAIRTQSAIFRYILWATEQIDADIAFIDLGPNLGALNRCSLTASDYFIVPIAPDLFSLKGIENLGNKLALWKREWKQCADAWNTAESDEELRIPSGDPIFAGYVLQQHNVRSTSKDGMTKGWSIYNSQIEEAVKRLLAEKLELTHQSQWELGKIPNLDSLVPYSQNARKPIYECKSADGLRGEHITKARDSKKLYDEIIDNIEEILQR